MEATKRCPYCGEEILATAKKCRYCGEWLEEKQPKKKKQVPCNVCGEMIDEDVDVCPFCHEKVKRETSEVDAHQAAADTHPTTNDSRSNEVKEERPVTTTVDTTTHDSPSTVHPTEADSGQTDIPDKEEQGYFKHYFIDAITKHYADFKGTATMYDYLFYILYTVLLGACIYCLSFISPTLYLVLGTIVALGLLLPGLAICFRRLHDLGKSLLWLFILLIPLIGPIILFFILISQNGKKKDPVVKNTILDYVTGVIGVIGIVLSILLNFIPLPHSGNKYNIDPNLLVPEVVEEDEYSKTPNTDSNLSMSEADVEEEYSKTSDMNSNPSIPEASVKKDEYNNTSKDSGTNPANSSTAGSNANKESIIAKDNSSTDAKEAVEMKYTPVAETVEEDLEEQKIYQVVEDMPEFPGGMGECMKYLAKNIQYPTASKENGVQGRVIVQFVVNKDGSITDAEVIRSVDSYLDKEALRIVSSMPKWTPGKNNGKPVRVRYTLPVVFKLQ